MINLHYLIAVQGYGAPFCFIYQGRCSVYPHETDAKYIHQQALKKALGVGDMAAFVILYHGNLI